ncbi:GOLPH3/VPS74 family protein [Catenulispora subtropica]|uniref:GPP34 family phosphoprotein n=1 Tax=Catenulispora subtropica TaxID=450798 RepID=A0ABN2T9T9_9ACTN
MDTLGEDILLLAIKPDGRFVSTDLGYALAGSELVRLAVRRRVDVVKDRIHVLDPTPTGDPNLDAALGSIVGKPRPPGAKSWVGSPRRRIVEAYRAQMEAAGVIHADRSRGFLGLVTITRWTVLDVARQAEVRARLDAIAFSGGPVDSAQAALGGLVYAVGLHTVLYPGRPGKPMRERLKAVAKKRTTAPVRSAIDGAIRASTDSAVSAAGDAAIQASVDAATAAAIDASVQAATDAAIAASIDAAVNASIDAAVSASIDAAVSASVDAATSHSHSHDGGGGGGHHH